MKRKETRIKYNIGKETTDFKLENNEAMKFGSYNYL